MSESISILPGIYGGLFGASIVLPFIVSHLCDSVKINFQARYALNCIRLGEDPRNYKNFLYEAKDDGLAGMLMGGRKALYRAVREGRTRRTLED